jgi:hypothetical integral membrane protein (TIGR02206 family)
MWKYFFAYESDLPPGSGFPPFSPQHLSWVFPALAAIAALLLLHRRLKPAGRRRMEMALGAAVFATYALRWTWGLAIGHFHWREMLPLHLCDATALAVALAAFTGWKPLKEFGYACGLPGAAVVFLTPGIGDYPVLHFNYLVFILDHSVLILLPLAWVVNGGFRPDWRRLPACFGFVAALAGVDRVVNRLVGANFMFLNAVPSDSFWAPAAAWIGPAYPLAMGALMVAVWVVLYLPWVVAARRAKGAPHDAQA